MSSRRLSLSLATALLMACGTVEDPQIGASSQAVYNRKSVPQMSTLAPSIFRIAANQGVFEYACTATKVGPNMLLTAGHCLFNSSNTRLAGYLPGGTFRYINPSYYLNSIQFLDSGTLRTQNVYLFPDSSRYDLALIEVAPESIFSSRPSLPVHIGYHPAWDAGVILAGFGYNTGPHSGTNTSLGAGLSLIAGFGDSQFFTYNNLAGWTSLADGDSGGGVFDATGTYVVGVNQARDAAMNLHVRLDSKPITDWITQFYGRVNIVGSPQPESEVCARSPATLVARVANNSSADVNMHVILRTSRQDFTLVSQVTAPRGGGWVSHRVDLRNANISGFLSTVALNPKYPGVNGTFGFESVQLLDAYDQPLQNNWFDGYDMTQRDNWVCDRAACNKYGFIPDLSNGTYWSDGVRWSARLGNDSSFQISQNHLCLGKVNGQACGAPGECRGGACVAGLCASR